MNILDDVDAEFTALVNEEGQYSIWPAVKETPPGWVSAGYSGKRPDCLLFIESRWRDMRPRSLADAT
jgi:MbtH protein